MVVRTVEILKMAKKKGMEFIIGLINHVTKGNGRITYSMDMENMNGQMVGDILGTGTKIK